MKQTLQFKHEHDPRFRPGHGSAFFWLFHNGSGIEIFSCIYDSTKYDSPVTQIMEENKSFFETRPDCHFIGGKIIPMKRPQRVELCLLCEN